MGVPRPAPAMLAALLAATMSPAHAEGRAEFVSCEAMVRAAQPAQAQAVAQPEEAALARCRQIIRDWTLRESRMSVDENGKPLR